MKAFQRALRRGVVVVLAGALQLPAVRPAEACAVLPGKGAAAAPDLSAERVLIVYDRAKETEHFLREVRFQKVSATFAFLVPTPAKPEVEKVVEAPFDKLAEAFPFDPPEQTPLVDNAKSAGVPRGVTVHEVKRVGSFTAFVLSATDGAALDRWLSENDIAKPPNAIAWFQHFTDLGFFITAFRYEPPAPGEPGEMGAETVRLSFATKEAYYPYIEPARDKEGPERELLVWSIATDNLVPAALFAPAGAAAYWGTAWTEGASYTADRGRLQTLLPGISSLLPAAGDLQVQTFQDYRASRNGVSDIVLAKDGDRPSDAGFQSHAKALIGSLDKPLHTGEVARPTAEGPPEIFRVKPPAARGCTCGVIGTKEDAGVGGWGLLALFALGGAIGARRGGGRAKPAG